jgi:hypothetical protein
MKGLRILTLASAVFALGTLPITQAALHATAAAQSARIITGEFVAQGGNQFRIVGRGSGFKAPAGTPMQALDGRTVRVELSPGGQVRSITEAPVPISPVLHGWSTIRGQVKVLDPATRRFTFASDSEAYVAPASIDIAAYDGKMVEMKLDEKGDVSEIRLVSPPPSGALSVEPASGSCLYQGQTYSAGAAVCQSGIQYRCDGARWQSLGSGCQAISASDAPARPPREPRSCPVGDATVAPGSSICRSGTTYRCDDGAWINMQTPCR